jgi:hypothetical protein
MRSGGDERGQEVAWSSGHGSKHILSELWKLVARKLTVRNANRYMSKMTSSQS